mgnify:CR=1 FL=1
MTRRPFQPPAHAEAMPRPSTSSSGVGTYGGLNSCRHAAGTAVVGGGCARTRHDARSHLPMQRG